MSPCPLSITDSGPAWTNWTLEHDLKTLIACDHKPKLLVLPTYADIDDDSVATPARTCVSFEGDNVDNNAMAEAGFGDAAPHNINVTLGWIDATGKTIVPQSITALRQLQAWFLLDEASNLTAGYAQYGQTAVGVYIGTRVNSRGFVYQAITQFINYIFNKDDPTQNIFMEYCDANTTAGTAFGLVADTSGGVQALANAQKAVQAWSKGECMETEDLDGAESAGSVAWLAAPVVSQNETFQGNGSSNATLSSRSAFLHRRAECATIQAVLDDSCATLATGCGVEGYLFEEYNSFVDNLCSTITVGAHYCCSEGDLPDFKPQPNADGSCATYTVQPGEYCSLIAAQYSLTSDELDELNQDTWGWDGCDNVLPDTIICVSEGSPPMPNPIANAVCGPQVPGTEKPEGDDYDLAELNPCPLNVCCNIWGQCGITSEFCTKSGNNRCISNCGTTIVNNDVAPETYRKVVYFEAWNRERNCLWWDVDNLDLTGVTHVHFAFARLTEDFQVDVSHVQDQFDKFKKLDTSAKRIIAFGGWADSTEADKFMIWRNAVQPANRVDVAITIAAFIKDNGFDGVDIDWEYPAEQDIPDIAADDPENGQNYYIFLQALRLLLGDEKSLSIAAPASYWYLKPIPIDDIIEVLDYLVYMSYDFHGQWDYGNKYSEDGCPEGNCLRSHINLTETYSALVMVTKAGVPTHKIVTGVSSYGRSFKMAEAGCTGPMCRYIGPDSAARKGMCTGTAGYLSNAEIDYIVDNSDVESFHDAASNSDILVYDDTEWVAYMTETTKATRTAMYQALNLGGTTDWAIDLAAFSDDELSYAGVLKELYETGNCTWRTADGYDCLIEEIRHALEYTRSERWHGARAHCAWYNLAFVEWPDSDQYTMIVDGDSDYPFSLWISDQLNGPDDFYCASMRADACSGGSELCVNTEDAGPASFMILNSFKALHSGFYSLFDAFDRAQGNLTTLMDAFVTTFAPPEDDDLGTKYLLMDIATIGLGLLLPPVFNKIFKGSTDNVRDGTYALVPGLFTLGKDVMSASESDNAPAISALLASVVNAWNEALARGLQDIMNGRGDALNNLTALFEDGKLIEGRDDLTEPLSDIALANMAERALLATLIPDAWKIKSDTYPVVLLTGSDCSDTGVLDTKMAAAQANQSWGCDVNDNLYFLVSAADDYVGSTCSCTPVASGGYTSCPECNLVERPFRALDGITELARGSAAGSDFNPYKKDNWGGITIMDLINGSLATYDKFGGNDAVTHEAGETFEWFSYDLWTNDTGMNIRAPGVVRIPVCSVEEAEDNWKKSASTKGDNYPCN